MNFLEISALVQFLPQGRVAVYKHLLLVRAEVGKVEVAVCKPLLPVRVEMGTVKTKRN